MKPEVGSGIVVEDVVDVGSDDPPPGSVRRPVVVTSSGGGVVDPASGEMDVPQAESTSASAPSAAQS